MNAPWVHIEAHAAFPQPDDVQCVLDLVHLSRQTMGDRSLETELLELFDGQAAGAIARLTGPGANGPAAAEIAHMLKGSARSVGAFAVASAAESLENALRAGVAATRPLRELAGAVAEARRTVASLLD